jgi:hypothetical protein
MRRALLVLLSLLIPASGCSRQVNPSFSLSDSEAQSALKQMRVEPKPLSRPLVLLGGFADFGIGTALMENRVKPLFDRPDLLIITFGDCTSFEQCRQRVIETIDRRFPNQRNLDRTAEVDVIGQSMGGLIALYSAVDLKDGSSRLNARRIFTLSSPLQGAKLAINAPLTLTNMHRDLRPDSPLYRKLTQMQFDGDLFSYTGLNDNIVGEQFASAPGRGVWWVDTPAIGSAHLRGIMDDRVLADVARRLRGETPYAIEPPAPLPERG